MRCVQKRYKNVNDAFIFAVTRPLMDAFHHELISFLVPWLWSCFHPHNLCRSAEQTLQMESVLNISAFLYHSLDDTWLPCDSTWEAVVRVMMMTQQCQPSGTSAPRRALQTSAASLPSSCGGDNLLGDGSRLTCLGQTDAQCGFSCHRSGNVGYQEPHGGAKVASYPGGASRWAYLGLWASPWMQPDTVRSGNRVSASSQSDGSVFHLTALITPSEQEWEAKIKMMEGERWYNTRGYSGRSLSSLSLSPVLCPLSSVCFGFGSLD